MGAAPTILPEAVLRTSTLGPFPAKQLTLASIVPSGFQATSAQPSVPTSCSTALRAASRGGAVTRDPGIKTGAIPGELRVISCRLAIRGRLTPIVMTVAVAPFGDHVGNVAMKAGPPVPLLLGPSRRPGCQIVKVESLVGLPTG